MLAALATAVFLFSAPTDKAAEAFHPNSIIRAPTDKAAKASPIFGHQATQTIRLFRGCRLERSATRYWSVHDTTLDSHEPDRNFGGAPFLYGGSGKTILIEFQDLNRALGPNKKIVRATLVFSVTGGTNAAPASISQALVPWGEGPVPILMPVLQAPKGSEPQQQAALAATWKNRRSGTDAISWQIGGANGPSDSKPFAGSKPVVEDVERLRIEGLENLIQQLYDRPHSNHGIALTFEQPVEFFSSQGPRYRPMFELDVETSKPVDGPDLSVTLIERSPEYERYAISSGGTLNQDGVEVPLPGKATNAEAKHWPADGEEVTYTAHVKNVGNAPAKGFSATWTVRDRKGASFERLQELKPGEEARYTIKAPFKGRNKDHRQGSIFFLIEPSGPDACGANNALEIFDPALCIAAVVEKSAYEKISKGENFLGSHSFEDWAQAQVRTLNDVFFPQSRFSFAPDGALERLRIQRFEIVPDGSLSSRQQNLSVDGEWRISANGEVNAMDADRSAMREVLRAIGLATMDVSLKAPQRNDGSNGALRIRNGEGLLTMGAVDVYPGLMGFGDTRNDALFVPQQPIAYEPWPDKLLDNLSLENTDLLSATDVGGLNSQIGQRSGETGDYLHDLPGLIFLRAKDRNGRAIPNAKLEFFQMKGGVITDDAPVITVQTDSKGIVFMPKRTSPQFQAIPTATGHTLAPSLFGVVDLRGLNSVMAVRTTSVNGPEWAWLKLWHLVDSARRGQQGPVFTDLRFNVTDGKIDATTNHAKGRIISDSVQSLPAKLVGLVDDDLSTSAALPQPTDSWIEIDLGRDRMIGEVRLYSKGEPFWQRFDILVYGTGQSVSEAFTFGAETNWAWSAANRAEFEPGAVRSVAYRAPAIRVRFIRIVNRGQPMAGSLAEIRVRPVLPNP